MQSSQPGPWEKEFDDFARAISGAFVFGIPLLFTMEMWWIGTSIDPWRLLLFLVFALGASAVLTFFSGFKQESTFYNTLNQAVDVVAVGLVTSTVVLMVLNRISPGDPLDSILGKVIVQAVPLSIGASVANAVFGRRGLNRTGDTSGHDEGYSLMRSTLNDLGATVVGGIFIGFSVAPTEEIPLLASQLDHWHELALISLSLVVTYIIVFESGFSPQDKDMREESLFHHPVTETLMAYVVSLLVALAVLFLFRQVTLGDPLPAVVSQVLVLGFPIAIGGAAGRLVI